MEHTEAELLRLPQSLRHNNGVSKLHAIECFKSAHAERQLAIKQFAQGDVDGVVLDPSCLRNSCRIRPISGRFTGENSDEAGDVDPGFSCGAQNGRSVYPAAENQAASIVLDTADTGLQGIYKLLTAFRRET